MAVAMSLPFVGWFFHWLRHKLAGTKCAIDTSCTPECDHPVVKDEGVYDPLDP